MQNDLDLRTLQLVSIDSIEPVGYHNSVDLTVEDDESFVLASGIVSHNSARRSIHESRGKNPYIGSFALKGKMLNVMDADEARVVGGKGEKNEGGNKEIINIMKITGLKIGVPVKSKKDLRFGRVVILTDNDLDGHHCASLLMNFFHYFWPEMFELGMIFKMNTPLVIAQVKKRGSDPEIHEFFNDEDYEAWAKAAPKHTAERFKGLGAFETETFKRLLENREKYLIKLKTFTEDDAEGLALAFKGSKADERKVWLEGVSYFDKFDE